MSKKTNDPLATRRLNNLPKASKIEDANPVKGAALRAAKKQYEGSTLPNTGPLAPPRTK
jgi:hypothetical protein